MVNFFRRIVEDMSCFGGPPFIIFYLCFLFVMGSIKLLAVTALSLFIGILLISAIRLIYHRLRPENRNRKHRINFRNIIEKIDDASFPSMHSMTATVVAYSFYVFNSRFIFISIGMAIAVFYSRNYLKKHYWTDIIAGAVLGIAVVLSVFYLFQV